MFRGVVRWFACVVVCFCACVFVVCLFSVFACSFLFCLVVCLCVRVLFARLSVSLLMFAKAFQNACQNGRKIIQKFIKIYEKKTGGNYKNGCLGRFLATSGHQVGTQKLEPEVMALWTISSVIQKLI